MLCYIIFSDEDEAAHYQQFIGRSCFACYNGYLNALEFTYSGVFD